jgi:hypothetical protein
MKKTNEYNCKLVYHVNDFNYFKENLKHITKENPGLHVILLSNKNTFIEILESFLGKDNLIKRNVKFYEIKIDKMNYIFINVNKINSLNLNKLKDNLINYKLKYLYIDYFDIYLINNIYLEIYYEISSYFDYEFLITYLYSSNLKKFIDELVLNKQFNIFYYNKYFKNNITNNIRCYFSRIKIWKNFVKKLNYKKKILVICKNNKQAKKYNSFFNKNEKLKSKTSFLDNFHEHKLVSGSNFCLFISVYEIFKIQNKRFDYIYLVYDLKCCVIPNYILYSLLNNKYNYSGFFTYSKFSSKNLNKYISKRLSQVYEKFTRRNINQ